ncbi:MAG: hypothetical protein ABFS32_17370 [Bacteroidota bacterium]
MKNILKYTLVLVFILGITQSCVKQADATYWEDYYTPPIPPVTETFTPDWSDGFNDFNRWTTLVNDGEGEVKLGNDPNSTWTKGDNGLNVIANDGWDHRLISQTVKGDFVAEIKIKLNSLNGTYPKAGLFVGSTGGEAPKTWIGLDGGTNNVYRFVPGPMWTNFGPDPMDVFQWHIIKVEKKGDKLTTIIDGVVYEELTNEAINNIEGDIGISVEAAQADIEYFRVNNFYDDFITLDNWGPKPTIASEWDTEGKGLKVFARQGWHHRAVGENVSENFIAEFKLKMHDALGMYPKAGIMIGELGDGEPQMLFGLDNFDGGSSIVTFIQGRGWKNIEIEGLNVEEWNVLRVRKQDDDIIFYKDGLEFYRETLSIGVQGKIGMLVEGCSADYEYVSYKSE